MSEDKKMCVKTHEEQLGRNQALGYVYKVTTIKPSIVSLMAYVPEFCLAIQNAETLLTNEIVYTVVKDVAKKMYSENGWLPTPAKKVLKGLAKDITGDSSSWKDEVYGEKS